MLKFDFDDINNKMRKTDRILVLKLMEGKEPVSSTGIIDPRLFKGENNLHAIMDEETCLWYMRYDKGVVPPALKSSSFTSFSKLYKYAKEYFAKRNIEIVEVLY